MTPRLVTETYYVTPQITPEDAEHVRAAGFRTVICNRPDGEIPPAVQADAVRAAVEAEGMTFHDLPFDSYTLNIDTVTAQRALIDAADPPVLAYCASGNRCTIVWALGEAMKGALAADEIIAMGAQAGYDLRGVRGMIDSLIANR